MKKFHEKTIISLASAMLFSSGLLLSMQASADYKRCDATIIVNTSGSGNSLMADTLCDTDQIFFEKGTKVYYYGAICSDKKKYNPVEARIILTKKTPDYFSKTVAMKRTEDQAIGNGRKMHIVKDNFVVTESGNYKARIWMTDLDFIRTNNVTPKKTQRQVDVRAFITDNPIEIPNKEHLRSLCD